MQVANPEIDYRKILIVYISTVSACEGTDFIGAEGLGDDLTPEENRALIAARDEAEAPWDRLREAVKALE